MNIIRCSVCHGHVDPHELEPLHPSESPTPWLTVGGEAVHPNAPAGGGGHGHFRHPRHFGARGNQAHTLAHPDSPAGKADLSPDDSARVEQLNQKKNPAPVATPKTQKVAKTIGTTTIDVDVKILADKHTFNDSKTKASAATKIDFDGVKLKHNADPVEGTNKFTNARCTMKGPLKIQTKYRPGVDINKTSGYGRGTTKKDKDAGDITLGFHESCHRQDFWDHYTTKDYPAFSVGKTEFTQQEFVTAAQNHRTAWGDFRKDAYDDSEAATDEVGKPKKSEFTP